MMHSLRADTGVFPSPAARAQRGPPVLRFDGMVALGLWPFKNSGVAPARASLARAAVHLEVRVGDGGQRIAFPDTAPKSRR